jgi:coproporphyrinogen III oxidase-like Fe-S oxidoreductase
MLYARGYCVSADAVMPTSRASSTSSPSRVAVLHTLQEAECVQMEASYQMLIRYVCWKICLSSCRYVDFQKLGATFWTPLPDVLKY